jgi:putative ATPase
MKNNQPLSEKLRPNDFDELIGQSHLIGKDKSLTLLSKNNPQSIILWGPSGVGKTTIARLLIKNWGCESIFLSAIFSGMKEIKESLEQSENSLMTPIVIFVDEIHRLNKVQQDAFLHHLEDGRVILIGATTENPSFELNSAILSRTQTYILKKLSDEELLALINITLEKIKISINFTKDALELLVAYANGDARKLINFLEHIIELDKKEINKDILKKILPNSLISFDKNKEEFYNHISALHKSIRGSDPDASLYWFCKMLSGGADPLYIGRRLLRIAYEDIGLADMNAANHVINALQTYERIGSPEGELALANCVIYLAITPKSNSVYNAYNKMIEFVGSNKSYEVPIHLRNAPIKLMKEVGYGKNYKYAHDFSEHYVPNEDYFPEEFPENLKRNNFYKPSSQGLEKKIQDRINFFRELDKKNKF